MGAAISLGKGNSGSALSLAFQFDGVFLPLWRPSLFLRAFPPVNAASGLLAMSMGVLLAACVRMDLVLVPISKWMSRRCRTFDARKECR